MIGILIKNTNHLMRRSAAHELSLRDGLLAGRRFLSRSEDVCRQCHPHSPTRLGHLWAYAAKRRRVFLPDGPLVGHLPPESAIPPHPRTTRKANPIFYPSLCTTDGTMHRDTIVDPMSQLPGHFKDNKNSGQNIIAAAIGSKSLITPALHRSYQSQGPQKVPCHW